MKRVVIIQRRMTHYRIPLFNKLKELLEKQQIELMVIYGDAREDELSRNDSGVLDWAVYVPCRYYINGKICWQNVLPYIKRADLVIVPQELKMIACLYATLFCRKTKIALWGHGKNFQSNESNSFLKWVKIKYSKAAHWWFVYTRISRDAVVEMGYDEAKITTLNNYIDDKQLRFWISELSSDLINKKKKEWGVVGNNIALYIGSLAPEKRINFLIDVCKKLRNLMCDFEILIVGDGVERTLLNNLSVDDKKWIRWVGALNGQDKAAALSIARLIINPGMVGLSIVDSFVAGRPMITCNIPIHSPEIAYLESGKNGLIVEDDLDAVVDSVRKLLIDDLQLKELSDSCIRDSFTYSLDAMADNFSKGIANAINC